MRFLGSIALVLSAVVLLIFGSRAMHDAPPATSNQSLETISATSLLLVGAAVLCTLLGAHGFASKQREPEPGAPVMNRDIAKGKWTQMKGLVRAQWGKLTDDDLQQMEGRSEVAIGRLQERYGHSREEAERAWGEFVGRCDRESS